MGWLPIGWRAPRSILNAIVIVASFLGLNPSLCAQNLSLIPVRKSPMPLARRDASTQWTLRLKKDVVVDSPLLRLRDVVEPFDQSSPWWERAGAAIIGLMPLDSQEMVIDRDRLVEAMARSSAIPDVQWSGSDEVRVTFRRLSASAESNAMPVLETEPTALVAGYAESRNRQARPEANADESQHRSLLPAPKNTDRVLSAKPPMTPTERERVTKLIQYAIDRYDVRLRDAFEIEIDTKQESIDSLSDLRRVDTVSWETTPSEGFNVAKVVGVNSREPITASVEIAFSARPLVVVAREGLRRGQVITEADVELIPAARNVSTDDVITNIDDAIGFQVQTTLQKKRPLTRSSIAPATVIERGELVELVVAGGGITVATGAKSLAPGAQGDLIPIETLEPRRKLMARVAGPGQVEILTRPPRVQ